MEHHTTACVSYRTSHHFFRRPDIPLVRINMPATRQLSVAFLSTSPSTSMEVVELFIKVHILDHSLRHNRHPLIYSCGVSVEELMCLEKLWTLDEISRRIMIGAAIARMDQKQTERMRSQRNRFKSWSRSSMYAVPLIRLVFHDECLAALPWIAMLITGTAVYMKAKLLGAAIPTVIYLNPAVA